MRHHREIGTKQMLENACVSQILWEGQRLNCLDRRVLKVLNVAGDDEIKPLCLRTGHSDIVLEITAWQRTSTQQYLFIYWYDFQC